MKLRMLVSLFPEGCSNCFSIHLIFYGPRSVNQILKTERICTRSADTKSSFTTKAADLTQAFWGSGTRGISSWNRLLSSMVLAHTHSHILHIHTNTYALTQCTAGTTPRIHVGVAQTTWTFRNAVRLPNIAIWLLSFGTTMNRKLKIFWTESDKRRG